ncbi:hypothetical protein D3C71_1524510 [compost metagenome]
MVDHHHVGRLRLLPCLHDEAVIPEGALGAQAVIDGGGHHRVQRRVLRQGLQLGHVAVLRAPGPGQDALELRDLLRGTETGFAPGLLQPIAAQIVGAALQQRTAVAHTERGPYARQIAVIQLILQRAGAGGDDGLQPGQQRGHQVRIGLAGAGAGLGQQHVALVERFGDRRGQAQLGRARNEGIELAGERTALTEGIAAGVGKLGHDAMIMGADRCPALRRHASDCIAPISSA